jgi:hypothetical protein
MARLQTIVKSAMGLPQDAYINRLIASAAEVARSDQPDRLLDPLDSTFAPKRGPMESMETVWPPFLVAIRKAAEERATEVSRAITDWLIRLVEIPGKRLKAGGSTATFLLNEFTSLTEKIEVRVKQIAAGRLALRQQIETDRTGKTGGLGWISRALGAGRQAELRVPAYCRLWLQEVTEETILVILDVVKKALKSFLAELALHQERVEEFAGLFASALDHERPSHAPMSPVSPDEAESLAGFTGTPESLPQSLVFRFDRAFQCEVLERQGGLWGVFASDLARPGIDADKVPRQALLEDLQTRARAAVQGSLQDFNAARAFLQANGGPTQALPILLAHVEAARPRLRAPGAVEHLIIALPEGPAGATLGRMITNALPDVEATMIPTQEEVVLCNETALCPLRDMIRGLVGPVEVPLDLLQRVMTRTDVPWKLGDLAPR